MQMSRNRNIFKISLLLAAFLVLFVSCGSNSTNSLVTDTDSLEVLGSLGLTKDITSGCSEELFDNTEELSEDKSVEESIENTVTKETRNIQPVITEVENSNDNTSENLSSEKSVDYILNIKSKKIHYPSCRGVATMKEENKQYFDGTKEEAISQGYSPCGICKP